MNEKKTMISIIIPVYNCEAYLPSCIDSILCQSYHDFEVILVDDCSKDSSYQICEKYASMDSRVIALQNVKNSGTSKARNVGINAASGEFIALVDDDDILDKDFLKILLEKQQLYDADIVQCNFKKFRKAEELETKKKKSLGKDIICSNLQAIHSLYEEHGVQVCVVFNKLYKRSVFDTVCFDDGKVHEDYFIIHKLLYKSEKIVFIDDDLYFYRKSEGSITGRPFSKTRLDEVEAAEQRAYFFKNKDRELYLRCLIQMAELQVNVYYNMKVTFPEDKEEQFLIRTNFKRYFKIISKHKELMTPKAMKDIFNFKRWPRLYYQLEYKNRLNFFTQE